MDDTIERRWGKCIAARGIYRDPVRFSKGHFVKASALRWLSVMLLAPIPWASRVWALPFLAALCPSERYYAQRKRTHKPLTDSSFAALDLLGAVRHRVSVITRLRLDAALYEPALLPARQVRWDARAAKALACPHSRMCWPIPPPCGTA